MIFRLIRLFGSVLLGIYALPATAETPFERQVLAELNALRANPAKYADDLERYRAFYHDKIIVVPGAPVRIATEEGVAPVNEAIAYLREQRPHGDFVPAKQLAAAASDHCAEQGVDGAVGHVGGDGSTPSERVTRRGGGIYVSEVIAYGGATPTDMVRQLLIDDGVPDRGHRTLLLVENLRYAGVSCGPHPVYRIMCVVDFARTPDARPMVQMARAEYMAWPRH